MQILSASAALLLFASGCTAPSGKAPSTRLDARPGGTEVGTSFPGLNQATTDTTATRSNDTSH